MENDFIKWVLGGIISLGSIIFAAFARYVFSEKQRGDDRAHETERALHVTQGTLRELASRVSFVESSHTRCNKEMTENIIRLHQRIEDTETKLGAKIDRQNEGLQSMAVSVARLAVSVESIHEHLKQREYEKNEHQK